MAGLKETRRGEGATDALDEEDHARRRAAKLINERLKLAAGFLNTLGVAVFVAAFLSPTVAGTNASTLVLALGFLIAVVLHLIGQGLLTAWRSED